MFSRFRGKGSEGQDPQPVNAADAQGLRLDLAENDRTIRTLTAELEHERTSKREEIDAISRARLRAVLESLAPAAVQLELQRGLVAAGMEVTSRDVLLIVGRLLGSLRDAGLETVGTIGDIEPFDPERHAPLDSSSRPPVGTPVRVRIPGAQFDGVSLVKIAVQGANLA